MSVTESIVEAAAPTWFGELAPQSREVGHGPHQSRTVAKLRAPAVAGLPKPQSGEMSVAGIENLAL